MDKIFIKTLGCSLNHADSERMAGLLTKSGFKIVYRADDAQLIILNTCTVKTPTDTAVESLINEIQQSGKKIVIAGCYPQSQPEKAEGYSAIGPNQLSHIPTVVEETLSGNTVTMLVQEKEDKLMMPRIRRQSHIEIVPISQGCLGSCSYCIVKSSRGTLYSYPQESIVKRISDAVGEGIKEIWLTSQDTGCYGMDLSQTLPDLLTKIQKIPGDFKVRLGMANPDHVMTMIDPLLNCLKSEKFFSFLHIPVQSGSDDILKRMNRRYTAKDFRNIVKRAREEIPRMNIMTDIIAGFPGETKEQFMDSIRLMQETMPDAINRSRFWARPGTPAADLPDQVNPSEIKDRSRFLLTEYERLSYARNKTWIGWEGEVIVDEHGKDGTMVARNPSYKPAILQGEFRLGQILRVKVFHSTIYDLRARVIPG